MFSVIISKNVWTLPLDQGAHPEGAKVAILERTVMLPFAPFAGLNIREPDWESGPLVRIVWMTGAWEGDSGYFRCDVKDEYPSGEPSGRSYGDLMESAAESGWTRPTKGGGDAPR